MTKVADTSIMMKGIIRYIIVRLIYNAFKDTKGNQRRYYDEGQPSTNWYHLLFMAVVVGGVIVFLLFISNQAGG